jgi:geranylgeranylglycerol-phosphate geranylgeranyltransferase
MKKLKAIIQLTRPVNLVIAFISIFIGGFVTGTIQPLLKLILACISGTLITAGANSINDYFDIEIDKINKPERPLPSGKITKKQAYIISIILFITGIIISTYIHLTGFIIALTTSYLLYMYSYKLKQTVLFGNLTIAFLSGLAFVYGGLAVGQGKQAVVVGIFAFLFHLGREIIKDIEDIEGDKAKGLTTLPIRYGKMKAMQLASWVLITLMFLTIIPYFIRLFSVIYLIIVTIGVNFFLIYVIESMWKKPEKNNLRRLAALMKADMLVGLLAVWLGS